MHLLTNEALHRRIGVIRIVLITVLLTAACEKLDNDQDKGNQDALVGFTTITDSQGRCPVVSLHRETLGYAIDTRLMVAVWSDGLLVWSSSLIDGGPPYYRATLDKELVQATANRMATKFRSANLDHIGSLGLHTWNSIIRVTTDDGTIQLVTTQESVNHDRQQQEPVRLLWQRLWDTAVAIVPDTGYESAADAFSIEMKFD